MYQKMSDVDGLAAAKERIERLKNDLSVDLSQEASLEEGEEVEVEDHLIVGGKVAKETESSNKNAGSYGTGSSAFDGEDNLRARSYRHSPINCGGEVEHEAEHEVGGQNGMPEGLFYDHFDDRWATDAERRPLPSRVHIKPLVPRQPRGSGSTARRKAASTAGDNANKPKRSTSLGVGYLGVAWPEKDANREAAAAALDLKQRLREAELRRRHAARRAADERRAEANRALARVRRLELAAFREDEEARRCREAALLLSERQLASAYAQRQKQQIVGLKQARAAQLSQGHPSHKDVPNAKGKEMRSSRQVPHALNKKSTSRPMRKTKKTSRSAQPLGEKNGWWNECDDNDADAADSDGSDVAVPGSFATVANEGATSTRMSVRRLQDHQAESSSANDLPSQIPPSSSYPDGASGVSTISSSARSVVSTSAVPQKPSEAQQSGTALTNEEGSSARGEENEEPATDGTSVEEGAAREGLPTSRVAEHVVLNAKEGPVPAFEDADSESLEKHIEACAASKVDSVPPPLPPFVPAPAAARNSDAAAAMPEPLPQQPRELAVFVPEAAKEAAAAAAPEGLSPRSERGEEEEEEEEEEEPMDGGPFGRWGSGGGSLPPPPDSTVHGSSTAGSHPARAGGSRGASSMTSVAMTSLNIEAGGSSTARGATAWRLQDRAASSTARKASSSGVKAGGGGGRPLKKKAAAPKPWDEAAQLLESIQTTAAAVAAARLPLEGSAESRFEARYKNDPRHFTSAGTSKKKPSQASASGAHGAAGAAGGYGGGGAGFSKGAPTSTRANKAMGARLSEMRTIAQQLSRLQEGLASDFANAPTRSVKATPPVPPFSTTKRHERSNNNDGNGNSDRYRDGQHQHRGGRNGSIKSHGSSSREGGPPTWMLPTASSLAGPKSAGKGAPRSESALPSPPPHNAQNGERLSARKKGRSSSARASSNRSVGASTGSTGAGGATSRERFEDYYAAKYHAEVYESVTTVESSAMEQQVLEAAGAALAACVMRPSAPPVIITVSSFLPTVQFQREPLFAIRTMPIFPFRYTRLLRVVGVFFTPLRIVHGRIMCSCGVLLSFRCGTRKCFPTPKPPFAGGTTPWGTSAATATLRRRSTDWT